jgi:aminopeptidase-like protein
VFAPGDRIVVLAEQNEPDLGESARGSSSSWAIVALNKKVATDTLTDATAGYVLSQIGPESSVIPFSPYGYDERQLCSPGFNLPVGRLTRSVNDGYPQYHTSADDLTLIEPGCLEQSLEACKLFVTVLEEDARYVNLSPKGEPRLGKRGLYGSVGGRSPAEREQAMLWVLNQSDGSKSLLDVARRSGLPFGVLGSSQRIGEVGVAPRDQ